MRMNLGACFGPSLFALDTAIKTMIRGSVWNLTFLEEGVGSRRNVAGTFLQTKSMNESSLSNLMRSMSMYSHWYGNIFLKSKLLKILPVIILS